MKRTQLATSLLLTAFASFFAVPGCNTSTSLQPVPQSEDGGSAGDTGGVAGLSTGGAIAGNVGGGVHTGGTPGVGATGGTPGAATGGKAATPTGGTPGVATGGSPVVTATGGAPVVTATGGAPVVTATGGAPVVTATGGAPVVTATGGAASTGTGKTVTFATGKGVGAMLGYAFVAMGATDTVSSPTCGTAAITATTPCTTGTTWNSATAICVTGNVPIVDAPTYASWGISLGLNATDPAGLGIGQAFTSIAITVTGSPTTGLRAIVHRKGDLESVSYCAMMTSGTAIALTTFQTDCYNGATATGAKILTADIPNIDKVIVQVSAGTAAIPVTNLCITGITFT